MPVMRLGVPTPAHSGTDAHERATFLARTIRGLETIAADELRAAGHSVTAMAKRSVFVEADAERIVRRPPRTIDDLLRVVLRAPDPGRTKADLPAVHRLVRDAALPPVCTPAAPGDDPDPAALAVSATCSGRRTYNRYDIEDAVGRALAGRFDVRYTSRRGGNRPPTHAVEWRVILDDAGMTLAVRCAATPLHRRPWKTATIPGTLRAPVAAAMVHLAEIRPSHVVADPCCGAGTILVEAHECQPTARLLGGDIDARALTAARTNAGARRRLRWSQLDAAQLPTRTGAIDRIVTNPPWGRQVPSRRTITTLLSEWRRAINPAGALVCLLSPEQSDAAHDHHDWNIASVHPITLTGRHPYIIVARPRVHAVQQKS